MHKKKALRLQFLTFTIVLISLMFAPAVMAEEASETSLAKQVAALKLGFGKYFIGNTLSAEQQEIAKSNPVDDAYAGTYKFKDEDVFVVADQNSNLILATYKESAQTSREQMKEIIGNLMLQYGEPTTMAHSKIIYWAFGPEGLIPENEYLSAKETGMIEILATVKLSSKEEINPDDPPKTETSAEETPAAETKSVKESTSEVYILISSDPLIKRFMGK